MPKRCPLLHWGEHMEGFEEWKVKLEDWKISVETRLAVAESSIKDIKEDLSSIKQNTTWLLRIIIGAIIMGVLGLIIKGGL